MDDEPTLRLGFRVALTTEGHDVTIAENGNSALQALARDEFDLLLLDLRMPGIDGLDVLRANIAAGRMVPAVLASAHIDDAVVLACLHLGVVDFLSKPVGLAELRETADLVLQEESAVGPGGGAPPEPVPAARWHLRRRDPARALAALDGDPAPGPRSFLWKRVVAHLVGATRPETLEGAGPRPSLRELLAWRDL
ncbi:MAG: response regulator [Akkermansiaceae bacterium]|nr:response regulator [Akkermansiaceae bacterium]